MQEFWLKREYDARQNDAPRRFDKCGLLERGSILGWRVCRELAGLNDFFASEPGIEICIQENIFAAIDKSYQQNA
jgi:hypothetical protein